MAQTADAIEPPVVYISPHPDFGLRVCFIRVSQQALTFDSFNATARKEYGTNDGTDPGAISLD